jgi:pimeloyl-ACP methyl ester carboxylesterase
MVTRLVLVATSGGLPVQHFGGQDWRQDYFGAFPMAARWVAQPVEDLSARLPQIPAPTLLLWGGADPISPPAVGERLRDLLPAARLCILADAGHDLAQTHSATVADQIRRHLDAAG